jgi:tetratricopeptide (TPR) repeat protein
MSQKKKPITAAASSEHTSVRSQRQPNTRQIQKYILVWLDASIDEVKNKDSIKTISKLREIIDTVRTFTNADDCIKFIASISEGTTFMISSGALGQTTVPIVHDMGQVNTIYIFCGNKSRHEQWVKEWPKVKGVFTDIKPICEALKEAVQECNQDFTQISFVAKSDDAADKTFNELHPTFMYTMILKEILLTIDFKQEDIKKFASYCRTVHDYDRKEIDEIIREYREHTPIWWYTRDCFLYPLLNRVIRTMDVDGIIKLGFFLCDLHRQIERLHFEQFGGHHNSMPLTVYRGQVLSRADFDQLNSLKGGLFSFNNILSTSKDRQVSLKFASHAIGKLNMIGVLFVMAINPSTSSTPFADLRGISYFDEDAEIVFSTHTVFRIREIKQMDGTNRLWQIDLTLTIDNDPELYALTERIREETLPNEGGWYRLGQLLIKMSLFNSALEVYNTLLEQTSVDSEKAKLYQQIAVAKSSQGEYKEAIIFSEKSLEINSKNLPPNHPDIATSYNNVGLLYTNMGDYAKALSTHEKALQIQQQSLPLNHPDLAFSYNNIGSVYEKMGECMQALSFQGKAFDMFQKTLPPNHPHLAASYDVLGKALNGMGECPKALTAHEKALQIRQTFLPSKHPDLAMSYHDIGKVYDNMGNYSKALSFYERALEIGQCSLPSDHPDLQTYKQNIESLKKKM